MKWVNENTTFTECSFKCHSFLQMQMHCAEYLCAVLHLVRNLAYFHLSSEPRNGGTRKLVARYANEP